MSAYSETPTNIDDGGMLIEALTAMGYQPTNCIDKPQPLVGYQGDFRTPDGEGHTTDPNKALKAHIIIPRRQVGGMSNDIGFVRTKDGKYTAILSDYDRGCGFNEGWVKKVNTGYQDIRINKIARNMGAKSVSKQVINGKIQYQFIKA